MMYATLSLGYAKCLVLRAFSSIGVANIAIEDVDLEKKQYTDHQTFIYNSGEDNLKIRCYYSGRITITGKLRDYAVNESLW